MGQTPIVDFSIRLKEIAKDLSFLGHPRYPLEQLNQLFPQHQNFIKELEDVSVPFNIDVKSKRLMMDQFLTDLEKADLPQEIRAIFTRRIEDYHSLIFMMQNFGTPFFYEHCTKLYGSSHKMIQNDAFLYFMEKIPQFCVPDKSEKKLKGEEALNYLKNRLLETFEDVDVDVKPSTSLLSDSSAGRKVLKLNPFKAYTTQQLNIFLVHEGWAHLGTSLNGASQTDHPWLSTWAPRTTFMQEGLAILTELVTGQMTHERWERVMLRHLATSMAERGSGIQDVYAYLRHHNMEELDAFKLALRVFRGVPLEGGMAFTKELLYLHGLVQLLYHLQFHQASLKSLWVGKISFEEHVMLLNHWPGMDSALRYFPQELDDPLVLARLKKLQELSYTLFRPDYL